MAIHAHPDDEASKGAATTARYAAEGAEVLIVTCTGGERGDVLNPSFIPPAGLTFNTLKERQAIRRMEMANSAKALGVQQMWLGFPDSGLPEQFEARYRNQVQTPHTPLADSPSTAKDSATTSTSQASPATNPGPMNAVRDGREVMGNAVDLLPDGCFVLTPIESAAAPLVEAIRRFRPHVITTYDPTGGYPHPDHIYTHTVSAEAWNAAHDPTQYVIDGGAPAWRPLKLYYNHGFSMDRLRAVNDAILESGLESPYGDWISSRGAREIPQRTVDCRVDVADYFAQRDEALRAHASQIDPTGFFFAAPRDIEAKVWPWDEYELANARIPVSLPENDLFAGIRGTAAVDQ
jgi:mycothiol S-conjugate amidase